MHQAGLVYLSMAGVDGSIVAHELMSEGPCRGHQMDVLTVNETETLV